MFIAGVALARLQEKKKSYDKPPEMKIDPNKQYFATLDTSKGKIVLELFPKEAPKSVNNFVALARDGFFDGTIFHRVIPGVMIQGGDPQGNGSGGPGYQFENENKDTKRTYEPGTVGMANAGADTNGSQFFIMDAATPLPPSKYTIFGQLKEGQDVVHAIATVDRNESDRPKEDVVLKRVTIEEK
jgi:peptidylprolyl isomerase/peptidyl-prolyl cis-trans isomerase B (cyclophilin B)